MTKAPVAGRAKSRLARDGGVALATRFARHATAALLARVGHDPRWQTILAVTPDADGDAGFWPRGLQRIAQGGGNLGQRMQRLMDRLPPGPVVIIGSDVPAIRATHIAQAFAALGRHDVVFGPAKDGGYWLVGMRRRGLVPRLFRNVRWSTAQALTDTLANCAQHEVAFVATLRDVDEVADLAAVGGCFSRRIQPSTVRSSA